MAGGNLIKWRPMKTRILIVLTVLAGTFIVAACGQRGPLYLPSADRPEPRKLEPVVPKRKSELPS